MHKWRPKKYYLVFVLVRFSSVVHKEHSFCILSAQTRLVSIFFLVPIYAFSLLFPIHTYNFKGCNNKLFVHLREPNKRNLLERSLWGLEILEKPPTVINNNNKE